jgi:hypothetical protein
LAQILATPTCPPFIVWTLQRTGGSNLAENLMAYAGPPYGLQEPFLADRAYGSIVKAWRRDRDAASVALAMGAICAEGVRLKHCVEILPFPLTSALLEASVGSGYRHVFIYRRSALDRLLSMHFAQVTGIWGPEERKTHAPDGVARHAALQAPLPIDKLVAHEEMSVRQLTQCWQYVRDRGGDPRAVAFEEVYCSAQAGAAIQILLDLLGYLGLARGDSEDHAWATQVLAEGNQSTRKQYASLPGVDTLRARLAALAPFDPTV